MPKTNKNRLLALLAVMGPGIIAAAAGNDAGGVATYATAGATYGYDLLWILLISCITLALVQEMCARMGATTGKGLSDLIREQFGVRWTILAMSALLAANMAVTTSEFAGVATAAEVFGVSRYIAVPLAAVFVWWVVVRGSYRSVEKVLIGLALLMMSYVVAAIIVPQDGAAIARGLFVPTVHLEGEYILLAVGMVGTTIAPWMLFYLQSSVVDKGIRISEYRETRIDVISGVVVAGFVAFCIITVTAATLHMQGIAVTSAADAAVALRPVVGPLAQNMFAAGLLGASLLSASILPLATSYAICEAFGWEASVSNSFGEAPAFFSIFTGVIVIACTLVLIPGVPLLRLMLFAESLNGVLLPIILVFILLLASDRRLMGRYATGRIHRGLSWGVTAALVVLSSTLLISTVGGLFV